MLKLMRKFLYFVMVAVLVGSPLTLFALPYQVIFLQAPKGDGSGASIVFSGVSIAPKLILSIGHAVEETALSILNGKKSQEYHPITLFLRDKETQQFSGWSTPCITLAQSPAQGANALDLSLLFCPGMDEGKLPSAPTSIRGFINNYKIPGNIVRFASYKALSGVSVDTISSVEENIVREDAVKKVILTGGAKISRFIIWDPGSGQSLDLEQGTSGSPVFQDGALVGLIVGKAYALPSYGPETPENQRKLEHMWYMIDGTTISKFLKSSLSAFQGSLAKQVLGLLQ